MKLITLLPFMDKEELTELANNIISGETKGVPLATLFPFLGKKAMDSIIEQLIQEGRKKDLYSALPFMSKQTINSLYDKVQNGELEGFKEEALLPFLGKDKIKDLFAKYVKEAEENPIDEEPDVEDMFKDADNE